MIVRQRKNNGFTLIELLVALTIFAVMSAGIFTIFNSFQNVKEVTDRDSKRLYEYQKAFTVIGRDISQMVPRPIRDEFGTSVNAVIGEEAALEFTRAGWNRPPFIKTTRSEMQRVKYLLEEGKLQRLYWNVLDRADNSEPKRIVVLENIQEIKFKYYNQTDQNEIAEEFDWPPQSNAPVASGPNGGASGTGSLCGIDNPALVKLPVMVEVTLVTDEFGELQKKYLIPTEYSNAVLALC